MSEENNRENEILESYRLRNQRPKDEPSFLAEIWDFIKSITISIIIVFLLTTFIVKPIRVDGSSMYPTLKDKQVGFSNIISLKVGGANRFDVVIVYVPQQDEYLVKRVIGLPGETISYRKDQLFIDGYPMEEDFLNDEYVAEVKSKIKGNFTTDFAEFTLAEDEYFLMGDNRPFSSDSRRFGPFKLENIISKDAYIIFPLNEIHFIIQ
ncbi:MAG: signal peptidase I [Erysipelothrix sp.]|nr:signal peptidase I [Erysipelothrix sp.]